MNSTKAIIILHSGWRVWFDDRLKPIRKEAQRLVEMLAKESLTMDDVRMAEEILLGPAKS